LEGILILFKNEELANTLTGTGIFIGWLVMLALMTLIMGRSTDGGQADRLLAAVFMLVLPLVASGLGWLLAVTSDA
jgi:hypothetical protein